MFVSDLVACDFEAPMDLLVGVLSVSRARECAKC